MRKIQLFLVLSVIFILNMTNLPSLRAQTKAGSASETVASMLSLSDIRVEVLKTNGLTVEGVISNGQFFETFDKKSKTYKAFEGELKVLVSVQKNKDSAEEDVDIVLKNGELPASLDVNTLRVMFPPALNDKSDFVMRLFFPQMLQGFVTIKPKDIELISIFGRLTEKDIKEVASGISDLQQKSIDKALDAASKINDYWNTVRNTSSSSNVNDFLSETTKKLEEEKKKRADLLKRFPADKGWGQEKYDAISAEYKSTVGGSYVDADEDFFYKNFEQWKIACDEAQEATRTQGERLLNLYPVEQGWNEKRYSEIRDKILAKEAVTNDEAVFAQGYTEWDKAFQSKLQKTRELYERFPEDLWTPERYLEIKGKVDANQTVATEEMDFYKLYYQVRDAKQWLLSYDPKYQK